MSNPLYPNSNSTGVKSAYEQASFMDDTAEEMARRKDDRIQRGLDTIDFEPRQSTAKTTNLDTLEIREEPKNAKKAQTTKKPQIPVSLLIVIVATCFLCPPIGIIWLLGTLATADYK